MFYVLCFDIMLALQLIKLIILSMLDNEMNWGRLFFWNCRYDLLRHSKHLGFSKFLISIMCFWRTCDINSIFIKIKIISISGYDIWSMHNLKYIRFWGRETNLLFSVNLT